MFFPSRIHDAPLYLLSVAAVFVRTEDSTTVGMRPRAALNQGEIDVRCSSPDSARARGGWLYGGIELIHGRFEWRIDRPSEVAGHRSIYTAFSRCTLDATSVTLTCDSYERQERAGVQHNNIRSEFSFTYTSTHPASMVRIVYMRQTQNLATAACPWLNPTVDHLVWRTGGCVS